MKLSMVHDLQGNISSVVAYPDDAPAPAVFLSEREQMTSIEEPELKAEQGGKAIHDRLTDIRSNFRLDTSTKRLVQK